MRAETNYTLGDYHVESPSPSGSLSHSLSLTHTRTHTHTQSSPALSSAQTDKIEDYVSRYIELPEYASSQHSGDWDGEGGERKTAATGGKLLQQALQQAQDELRQDRMGSRGGGKAVEHIVYASEVCVCACVWVYVSLCTCVCVCVHACV